MHQTSISLKNCIRVYASPQRDHLKCRCLHVPPVEREAIRSKAASDASRDKTTKNHPSKKRIHVGHTGHEWTEVSSDTRPIITADDSMCLSERPARRIPRQIVDSGEVKYHYSCCTKASDLSTSCHQTETFDLEASSTVPLRGNGHTPAGATEDIANISRR
jgi:hypothetical protein